MGSINISFALRNSGVQVNSNAATTSPKDHYQNITQFIAHFLDFAARIQVRDLKVRKLVLRTSLEI